MALILFIILGVYVWIRISRENHKTEVYNQRAIVNQSRQTSWLARVTNRDLEYAIKARMRNSAEYTNVWNEVSGVFAQIPSCANMTAAAMKPYRGKETYPREMVLMVCLAQHGLLEGWRAQMGVDIPPKDRKILRQQYCDVIMWVYEELNRRGLRVSLYAVLPAEYDAAGLRHNQKIAVNRGSSYDIDRWYRLEWGPG